MAEEEDSVEDVKLRDFIDIHLLKLGFFSLYTMRRNKVVLQCPTIT